MISTPTFARERIPGANSSPSHPTTRAEAAKEFEAHLVRQLVAVMFEGVFEDGVAGDGGGLASVGRDEQRDVLVNELTELLTTQGGLGLADTMIKQWEAKFGKAEETNNEQPLTAVEPPK